MENLLFKKFLSYSFSTTLFMKSFVVRPSEDLGRKFYENFLIILFFFLEVCFDMFRNSKIFKNKKENLKNLDL